MSDQVTIIQVQFGFVEGQIDKEGKTMGLLNQVMRTSGLTDQERMRVSDWFFKKYAYKDPFAGDKCEGAPGE